LHKLSAVMHLNSWEYLGLVKIGAELHLIGSDWLEMAGLVETRCRNAPGLRRYDSIIAVLVNTYVWYTQSMYCHRIAFCLENLNCKVP
jgi:hypothetical protein